MSRICDSDLPAATANKSVLRISLRLSAESERRRIFFRVGERGRGGKGNGRGEREGKWGKEESMREFSIFRSESTNRKAGRVSSPLSPPSDWPAASRDIPGHPGDPGNSIVPHHFSSSLRGGTKHPHETSTEYPEGEETFSHIFRLDSSSSFVGSPNYRR